MKIKAIIISLGLIITMISGIGVNYVKNTIDEVEVENTIASEDEITDDEILEVDENEVEQEKEEQVIENTEVKESQSTEEIKQAEQETAKVSVPQEMQISTATQKETISKNTQATTQIQEQTQSVVETPKEEIQSTKEVTPNDLEYWCVEGGTHHIAGDGANEHGYYNSWDEAQKAFENYTKGWSSYQYKIDTCACGLYYFWAIQ